MDDFQKELKRLEDNPDQVIRECEIFREEVISWLRKIVKEAEDGIRGTSDVELRLMGTSNCDPAIKLIAYSIALWDRENPQRPKVNLEGELGRVVGRYMADDELFDVPAGRYSPRNLSKHKFLNTGIISYRECRISVFVLPPKIEQDIDFSQCPEILRPIFGEMVYYDDSYSKTSVMQKFKRLINHEMTHAYITASLGSRWEDRYRLDYNYKIDDEHSMDLKIKSVDEGACQAVSSIVDPSSTTGVEHYQQQRRHTMGDLQFFKTCFMVYAERFDTKEEKVSQIRERAVESVKRIFNTKKRKSGRFDYTNLPLFKEYTIVSAVLDNHNPRLEKFRIILKKIEQAEKKSFYSLALLNVLEYDRDNHMKSFISEIESQTDSTIHQLASQDGSITQLIPENAEYKIYNPDVGEYGETTTQHEFDDSLYKIRNGLQHLLAIAGQNNNLKTEESRRLRSAVEEVEDAIEIFKEENKLENSIQSEVEAEYREDTEKIANWVKQRVEHGEYTDPVRIMSDLEVETEAILEDYLKMVEAGIQYNKKIGKKLEALHHDEKGVEQIINDPKKNIQNQEIKEMLKLTEHVFNLCGNSVEKLEEAKEELEAARTYLEQL